ncbi:MAG: ArnT family glycosyltransferase [Vicingaceae bacterium]
MNNTIVFLLLATFSYLYNMFKGWNKDVVLIILLGLLIRFALMPYTQTVHADAISRILNAENWLKNPHYILADVWGPLSTYLYGFSIEFLGGKIYGPKIINILFASFTAYPLYWFSKNIFKTRIGALFVAATYILTPIIIRNSFQALPAVTCAFFIASAMYHLSNYIKSKQLKSVVFAGVLITLAGALRYEAWVISFFLGTILLIQKEYKSFFIFGLVAAIFPISWLIGNQIVYDNWLYCFQYSSEWTINELEPLANVSQSKMVKRLLFFPFSLMVVLSPLFFLLMLIIIPNSILKKRINKEQLLWLIPFLGLLIIYTYKALSGSLLLQHKYSVTLILFILPFFALFFKQTSKRSTFIALLALALLIPSQFIYNAIPTQKILPFSSKSISSINNLLKDASRETAVIPKLSNPNFQLIVDASNNQIEPNDGVILDFLGWENTYYYALNSRKQPFIIRGNKKAKINTEQLNKYLTKYPNGLVTANGLGKLKVSITKNTQSIQIPKIKHLLKLTLVKEIDGFRLYRYKTEVTL